VVAPVSGLARGRTYHFRLVATSDAGTSHGADASFRTASAPTTVTSSASGIAATAARLNGSVNPNGLATTWYFQYGRSASYGSKTSQKSAGSGTSTVRVTASIGRLTAATTYHFRLVATNAAGTTIGGDRTFATAGPPAARTGAARDVGPTSATLMGSVDPAGRSTSWYFEYGTTTGYGSRTSSKGAGSSFGSRDAASGVSGLRPGTTYHYRLVARNDLGTTRGADATFATAGVTLTAPALQVVFGRGVMLSGMVPTGKAGEVVTLFAERFDGGSLASFATVVTGEGGGWRYLARPAIQTAYEAGWNGGLSPATVIGVRPAVSLRRTAKGFLATRVVAARSFAGRIVQLQRRTAAGRWRTVMRTRLGRRSGAVFKATLPHGTSVLRVAMSVNQAGPGYLAGFSRRIVVHA